MNNMSYKLEYVSVNDFGEIITGKTPKTEVVDYWNGDIPFITPTDIPTFDARYLFKTDRTISNFGYLKQKKTLLPSNSLCVSCIATIGKLCLTKVPSITNQQINSIIPNERYDSKYLFYTFRYHLPYLQLIGGGTGSGTPIINKGKFSKLKYPVILNKNIQIKIAKILDNYDNLIENNIKRIKLLENIAEELYKEWFVRFRFPGFENITFKCEKPIGWIYGKNHNYDNIPISWKYSEFQNIGTFVRGKNITASEMIEGEVPVISAGLEPSGYHNNFNVTGPSVTISASGANAGYLSYHQENIWAADCSYYSNEDNLWFAYNTLKFLQPVITNMQVGSAQPHVYAKSINKLTVLIPDDNIINLYEAKVKPLYEKIKLINQKNKNLIKQRDALLPRLMSGKLSVEGKEMI